MTTKLRGFMLRTAYFFSTFLYVFGGVIPYIPQYMTIYRTSSVKGFSTYVCLVLLIANILRVCFWFVQPFSLPLLAQSIVMILTMMVLMHLVAKVSYRENQNSLTKEHKSKGFKDYWFGQFWQWTNFGSYLICLTLFSLVSLLMTYSFSSNQWFIQSLGFAALFIEAMLGAPQFLRNYRNRSTKGMSLSMVLMWMCGDLFKTMYFIAEDAPLQFPVCGCIQIALDLAILSQCVIYES